MKDTVGLLGPVLLILFGIYALFTTLASRGEAVTLLGAHALSHGLAFMFGLMSLGGGGAVLCTVLAMRRHGSS
jgi:hypothetical protein